MLPDINGRERLHVETRDGKKMIDSTPVTDRWNDIRQQFVDYYRPASPDEAAEARQKQLESEADATYKDFNKKLQTYFADNVDDIAAYFGALDRFESDKERNQEAAFQKQRRWDRMMKLRQEADQWINDVKAQETAYKNSLYALLDPQQRELGTVPASWNPLRWSRAEQLSFAVTYSLTAIGLCLILGLCTPLAALGGAAFMCFVVATQPAWPTFYPPDPHVVGHALLINKDFVEMVALLVVSATAAGRWGGLDYFLNRFILRPLVNRRANKNAS